jgi:hypothetical protein
MPCSEAEVEQVFAHLRRLFGDHAQRSRCDLVEAHLTIMMNNLDVSCEIMRGLSQVEHEILRPPPRG